MKRRAQLSRRTFLKLTATAAAGAALASCTPKQSTIQPTDTAAAELKPTLPPSTTLGIGSTETAPAETTQAETNPTETAANPDPSNP